MSFITNGNMKKEMIEEIEKKYSFGFPDIYKTFLEKYNGVSLTGESKIIIKLAETDIDVRVSKLYGVDSDETLDDINQRYKHELTDEMFIIGECDKQGFVVLIYSQEEYFLCFWDEQMKLPLSTEEGNAYLLSDSINVFFDTINMIFEGGKKIMKNDEWLPLGSIVQLESNIQKIVIVGRGLVVKPEDEEYFFDYAGVRYPYGFVDDRLIYFNSDKIANIIHTGYRDADDNIIIENINRFLSENPKIKKAGQETETVQ